MKTLVSAVMLALYAASPAVLAAGANDQASAGAAKPNSEQMTKMDEQIKAMQEMHNKMTNAKTLEERNALMDEHMKTMRKSMAVMNGMMGGMMGTQLSGRQSMSPSMMQHEIETMQKQMQMMRMTMQMMMDRMGPPAPAK